MINRYFFLLIISSFLFRPVSFSQKAVMYQPGQIQADFDTLRKALEEAHGGLYRFSTKKETDKRFADYRKQLNREMNQQEFISILSGMLAEIRDGHMRLEYDETTTAALAKAPLLPLRTIIEDNRLMVLYNDTPDDETIQPGMEILSINGHKTFDLIQSILPKLSGDGFIETGKKRRLERSFASNYWLFVDTATEFTITAKDAAGKVITAKLMGVPNSERAANRSKNPVNNTIRASISTLDEAKENISLRFIENKETAAIRIRLFDGPDFISTIDSVFNVLHQEKTKIVILDLRGNGGGVDMYGAGLVSQFVNRPFRYFDHIHITSITPSFAIWKQKTFDGLRDGTVADPAGGYLVTSKLHKGVDEQLPASHPFLGKLIVLMDGMSFSTTADVLAQLDQHTKATFIGEETGGAYEGNTSGLDALLVLPNSKLKLRIPVYGYWNAVSSVQKGRGIFPDFSIDKKIADLLRGVDAQWNKALEIARKD